MAAGEEPPDAEDRIHAVVEPVRARWIAQIYRVLFKAFYEAVQLRIDHKSSYIERGAGRGGEPLAHCAQGGALLQRAQDLQHVRYCRLFLGVIPFADEG